MTGAEAMTDEALVTPATGIAVHNPAQSPLAAFRAAAQAGSLAVATRHGGQSFPPRLADASGQLETAAATDGIVYSATRVERRGDPYTLALVDLAGGGRVLAQVLAADAAALVGRAVRRVEGAQPFLTFATISPEPGA